jgi:hypothetical protein
MFMSSPRSTLAFRCCIAIPIGVVVLLAISATAQYSQTNLPSNISGEGSFTAT